MPSPTQDEEIDKWVGQLLQIYDQYLDESSIYDGADFWGSKLVKEHKAALHRLMLKERRDELLILPRNKLGDHVNEAGKRQDIAIVNYKFIENRIATLTPQIEGSKSDE